MTAVVLGGLTAAAATGSGQSGVTPIELPGGAAAAMYSLASAGAERAVLSWLEPSGPGHALRFSVFRGRRWSTPRTIVEGANLFANWADHPSIAETPDGSLLAQWPVVNPGPTPAGTLNNSLRIARSRDGGATWHPVFSDGTDNIHSYSGFVSLLPRRPGFSAVYLTPPRPVSRDPQDHRMTLSYMTADAHGKTAGPTVIDPDTCSCCPTAVAETSDGPIAAYRDHEPGEIRDIAIVRLVNGRWTPPRPIHRDGWEIHGCPTNGPELVAEGRAVAAAWFTGAGGVPRMKVAYSSDAGASFGSPTVVDGGRPVGRGALVMLPDRSVVVAWLESPAAGTGGGEVRVRRVSPGGVTGPMRTVAQVSTGRATGMLQMARVGDTLLVVWRGKRGLLGASVPARLL